MRVQGDLYVSTKHATPLLRVSDRRDDEGRWIKDLTNIRNALVSDDDECGVISESSESRGQLDVNVSAGKALWPTVCASIGGRKLTLTGKWVGGAVRRRS